MKTLMTALVLCFPTVFAIDGWENNLDVAKQKAEKENKQLLIVYRGKDWIPNVAGSPECMYASPYFKEWTDNKYICVELPYPNNIDDEKEKTITFFANPQGLPYHAFKDEWKNGTGWVKIEFDFAQKNRQKGFDRLIHQIETSEGDKKYKNIADLFINYFYRAISLKFCPQYVKWEDEILTHDSDDCLKAKAFFDKYENDGTTAMVRFAEIFSGKDTNEIYGKFEKIRLDENFSLDFRQLCSMSMLMYDQMMKEPEKENIKNYIISINPNSRISCFIQSKEGKEFFDMIDFIANLADIKENQEEAIKKINTFRKNNDLSPENRQTLAILEALCEIRQHKIDAGLKKLTKAKNMALWTAHAQQAKNIEERVRDNRELIEELLREKEEGKTERKDQLDNLLLFSFTMPFTVTS